MSLTAPQKIAVIGFGSQGMAWAECLRAAHWDVEIFLSQKSRSFERALLMEFKPKLLAELAGVLEQTKSKAPAMVAMLCPDTEIACVYETYLSELTLPLTLVLAHGYAIYADELKVRKPHHQAALFAPKAIGPKLRDAVLLAQKTKTAHSLCAAFSVGQSEAQSAGQSREPQLLALASALCFKPESLIPATFEQEAVGDLISEQGLLCGGVFTLLQKTIAAMEKAKVPHALIREECLTELELVAGLIRELGPSKAFQKISAAAQCGTILFKNRLQQAGIDEIFNEQLDEVVSKKFVSQFTSGAWKAQAQELKTSFQNWEKT